MPIRLDTLRERWLAQSRYLPTTQQTYRETLSHLQRRWPVHAERLTEAMLTDYLTVDDDGEPTMRAPNTLKRERATLRTFFRWARRSSYLKHDPSLNLDLLELGKGQRRAGRWLTKQDALTLLEWCLAQGDDRGIRDHTLIATALLGGLRRAELAGLRWRDVDLPQRRINVRGKGEKAATIGLPKQAAMALHNWRERYMSASGAPRRDDPVFPTGQPVGFEEQRGHLFDWHTPLTTWGVADIVQRRAEEAGLGTVATHDLRRSFAGFLDERGVPLQDLQAALRHSSPDTTVRAYLDKSPMRALRAVADLELS